MKIGVEEIVEVPDSRVGAGLLVSVISPAAGEVLVRFERTVAPNSLLEVAPVGSCPYVSGCSTVEVIESIGLEPSSEESDLVVENKDAV